MFVVNVSCRYCVDTITTQHARFATPNPGDPSRGGLEGAGAEELGAGEPDNEVQSYCVPLKAPKNRRTTLE